MNASRSRSLSNTAINELTPCSDYRVKLKETEGLNK